MKVAVVLLTWQRISSLKLTLKLLQQQTNQEFDVYISNGNLEETAINTIEKYIKHFSNLGLNIILFNDGNDLFTFRRFTVGKRLAKEGYDIIMYLDDDVTISRTYIAKCLNQYEAKTYKSGYAWEFYRGGQNYYKHRTRIHDVKAKPHYCGTGFSMIDSSFFLRDELFNYPPGSEKIEDLWLSYCVDQANGWRLAYMDVGDVNLKGSDDVALFREIMHSEMNKAQFLRMLVKMGWKIPN